MFARQKRGGCAPTAALHFTPRLMEALDQRGIGRETLTLHVGAGTFLPVKAEDTAAIGCTPNGAGSTSRRLSG